MAKAERGTKRVCRECGGKFYDLNRDPAACPLCGAVQTNEEPAAQASAPAEEKQETEPAETEAAGAAAAGTEGPEIVSLEDVQAEESSDDSVVEEEEVIDLEEEEDNNLPDSGSEDTFLEDDDDGDSDVSDIISTKMGGETDEP